MTARLSILESEYVLAARNARGEWMEIARLAGGSNALVPGRNPDGHVNEATLESAIEVAEDWLMPHARRIAGETLEIQEETGRFSAGMRALGSASATGWSLENIEALFLDVVNAVSGRMQRQALARAFVADFVLVRELAHHGRLHAVRLGSL